MSRISTLVVDDEPLARRGIRQLLEPHTTFEVAGECRNGRDAVRAIRTIKPTVVFLDVQMPGMSGFDVVREVGATDMPVVVFVTAYDAFAAKAFETHAIDYLVKPVTVRRFDAALARVHVVLRDRATLAFARRLQSMLGDVDAATAAARLAPERITVPTASGLVVVDVQEIDWIEADDYYAAIHARGRRLLLRESLASFEARLDPSRYVRVHRSAIVAVARITEMRATRPGGWVVVLRDGTHVPVSRRRKEEVEAVLSHR
ncbi:MAG: response regulator transcription factor [Cytophagaceae bacterium]|nr:response regulator transcription factor [Gemmatimonadaceae bacterium]